jgi:cytochrome oxidase Cu insertion factor (SCO1/SenC/PrrC family)
MASRAGLAVRRAGVAALLVFMLVANALPSIARADGDPASDYLLANQVFLTSASGSLSPAQRQLMNAVKAINRAGYTVRVAVIASPSDLGSITQLWRQPRTYAKFLGQELTLAYKQRLLVVTPNGYGFNWPGHSSAAEYRLLANLPIRAGRNGLAAAADTAVRRLAAADHVTPPISSQTSTTAAPPSSNQGAAVVLILVVVVVVCASIAVAVVLVRRRRLRPRVALWRRLEGPLPMRTHVSVAAVIGVCAVAAAVVIIVASGGRSSSSRSPSAVPTGPPTAQQARSVVTPPPLTWPAGRQRAPNFSLHDQSGGPVSVTQYRGREVIVAFIDPVCRNVCQAEAKVLDQAAQQLPPSQRPEIVAVSVNPYANARGNLLQDVRKWNLVPEWRWAVGSLPDLAAVWKSYNVAVQLNRTKVAGKTVSTVPHTAAAYIVDSTGHERALFVWPFYRQDVARVLRELA